PPDRIHPHSAVARVGPRPHTPLPRKRYAAWVVCQIVEKHPRWLDAQRARQPSPGWLHARSTSPCSPFLSPPVATATPSRAAGSLGDRTSHPCLTPCLRLLCRKIPEENRQAAPWTRAFS